MKKVIVIGLDGFEPKLVEGMFARQELPNLARLRAQGGCARVRTTHPAQTPVAWSTFATGVNPGAHGIFDFIRRDPRTYLPDLSFNRYEQKNAFTPPKAVNLRRATTIWELLSQAGIPSTVLRFPCTYPPDNIRGRILSGMGVPDLRGGLGTSTFYSADDSVVAQESEQVVRITATASNFIETQLYGPRDPKTKLDATFPIKIAFDPSQRSAVLRSDGDPAGLELREGEWSGWLKVKFKLGLFRAVRGMVRFLLVRTAPVFELYASPINFDPDAPLFDISSPAGYAAELSKQLGAFYTTGMPEDHNGLNNGRFGEEAYLAQCELLLSERRRMMRYELERVTEGFFFCLFDTPDRIQHMFWRFGSPDHPAGSEALKPEFRRTVEEHYRDCDAIVGEAMRYADDQTLFIVCSDHGMNSFERGFHINTWLHDQGLLALKRGLTPGESEGDFLRHMDWENSKAYALGLSGIYLNIKGREEHGIVAVDDAHKLKVSLASALTGLGDLAHNRLAIRSAIPREQVYAGHFADEAPDLLVNFAEGYRVSWATALGGVPAGNFEDNRKKWSGDHLIDPALVPGVLLMNRPFNESAGLIDMAPTILAALGLERTTVMEGENLLL